MPISLRVMIKSLAYKGHISSEKRDELLMKLDRHDSEIRADERSKTMEEYNGYRRKVINVATTEDFRQPKRVITIDIPEYLIKELSQEDLLRVIFDDIIEQLKEKKQ